jgi:hypothetical protein
MMIPSIVDFELLWGLIYLNLKVRSQPTLLEMRQYANAS